MPAYQSIDVMALKANTQAILEKELGAPDRKTGGVLFYHCPFHQEKTSSFAVYEDHWHCYGSCGKGGDVVDFIQRRYSLDFVKACKYLGADTTSQDAIEEYRKKREEKRLEEFAERQKAREEFDASARWLEFHYALTEESRSQWESVGVGEYWQDFWTLGFTSTKKFEYHDTFITSPALTIPMTTFRNGKPSMVVTMQYRLLQAPKDAGKYRFEWHLGTAAWIARPDLHPGDWGKVLVVEGAKKGMVSYIALGHEIIQVVAVPSKYDTGGIVPDLQQFEEVYVWLDPDVTQKPKNAGPKWEPGDIAICKAVGPQAKFVRYPRKIDDAILENGLTGPDILDIMKYTARKAMV